MVTFREYVRNHFNVEMPEGNISGLWFSQNSLPMVVRCACCDMSMASPSAWIDEDGNVFCSDCAEVEED